MIHTAYYLGDAGASGRTNWRYSLDQQLVGGCTVADVILPHGLFTLCKGRLFDYN